jgi:hypothetical protein
MERAGAYRFRASCEIQQRSKDNNARNRKRFLTLEKEQISERYIKPLAVSRVVRLLLKKVMIARMRSL